MCSDTTEPQTPTDQAPDAVRAAIAEAITASVVNWDSDGHPGFLPSVESLTAAVYDRLAQIGVLRPVGDGVSKADLRAAAEDMFSQAHHCSYLQEPDKWTNHTRGCNDGDHRLYALIDRLPIPDAAARAGDGAT